jgi:hypothetical protein
VSRFSRINLGLRVEAGRLAGLGATRCAIEATRGEIDL